jgi:uncharacterized protein
LPLAALGPSDRRERAALAAIVEGVAQRTDSFDLSTLRLSPGEGASADLLAAIEPLVFAGERYVSEPREVPVGLDISRTMGPGYALRVRFAVTLAGPCMRCLGEAGATIEIDSREVDQPDEGDELHSPYLDGGALDLHGWARDALVLALPAQILCRTDCRGLCQRCGADLNGDPEHAHEPEVDPRWAKLSELEFD